MALINIFDRGEKQVRIGSILFTYHRSEHTRKVIEALSKNDILPEKLYIFQDGIKASTNYDEWLKVNEPMSFR